MAEKGTDVRLVPGLVHNIGVEELLLPGEQLLAEPPEGVGLGLQDGDTGLVHQSAGRMPRLDLLPHDELDLHVAAQ